MKKIEATKLVKASEDNKFQQNLDAAIEELQAQGLEVEVSHAMCRACKGIGYMYSAVVTGRRD